MRTAAAAALLLLGPGCAHVEPPSGGPEDRTPPSLLVSRPDTLAVVPRWDAPVVLVFDERVSERGVQEAVQVSPRTSMVVVEHRGDEIRVRLRNGWQPGTIYHVTVQPGVQDLFNNRLAEPVTVVFSTGPEIPATALSGVVTDVITGKPEVGVRVEAVRAADSLVYAVPTDSSGEFSVRRIPEGEYRLRAFRDLNRNRALDDFEPRDTATVSVVAGDSVRRPLAVLMPDSTPARAASAELRDSVTIQVTFDDHLDPRQTIPPAAVQIRNPQGGFGPVQEVSIGGPPAAAAAPAAGRPPAADTAQRLPSQQLVVRLTGEVRLEPGATYTIELRGVRNVAGLVADAAVELEVAEPEPPRPATPADTARAAEPPARLDTARAVEPPVRTDTARVVLRGSRRPGSPEL